MHSYLLNSEEYPYNDPSYSLMDENEIAKRKQLLSTTLFNSTLIRVFTFIDGIFLLFWGILYWAFLFPLIFTICGYYGAKWYRTELLALYSVYILTIVGFRIYWIAAMVDDRVYFIAVTVIGIVFNLVILYTIMSLIYCISKLNNGEINLLRDINYLWWSDSIVIIESHPNTNSNNGRRFQQQNIKDPKNEATNETNETRSAFTDNNRVPV